MPFSPQQGYGTTGYHGSQSGYQYNTPSATPNVTAMQADDGRGGGALDLISEPELEILDSIVKKVKSSRKSAGGGQTNWN